MTKLNPFHDGFKYKSRAIDVKSSLMLCSNRTGRISLTDQFIPRILTICKRFKGLIVGLTQPGPAGTKRWIYKTC
jgi:hypothetical protein